jgi:hypothetical protein
MGIQPKSRKAWADMTNRFARSLKFPAAASGTSRRRR